MKVLLLVMSLFVTMLFGVNKLKVQPETPSIMDEIETIMEESPSYGDFE